MLLLKRLSHDVILYNVIEFFTRMFERFFAFFERFGELGLFMYSIFETITPMAGVEIFFATLISANKPWWRIALLATLANAVGATIIYLFIAKKNVKFYDKLLRKGHQERAHKLFARYGVWAIYIFAMTPLPFFIIIFTAAMAHMKFKPYIIAVLVSRGMRFFITTYIMERFTRINTFWVVLILIAISIPLAALMMLGQRKALHYFENQANVSEEKTL